MWLSLTSTLTPEGMWCEPDGRAFFVSSWTLRRWAEWTVLTRRTVAFPFLSWMEQETPLLCGDGMGRILGSHCNLLECIHMSPEAAWTLGISLTFYDLQMSPRSWASFSLEMQTHTFRIRSVFLEFSHHPVPGSPVFSKMYLGSPNLAETQKIFSLYSTEITDAA